MYFLKLYRKLFEYRTLIITIMQKPTMNAVQLRSMLEDFHRVLNDFDFEQAWEDSWNHGVMEKDTNGSRHNWNASLEVVTRHVTSAFLEQIL